LRFRLLRLRLLHLCRARLRLLKLLRALGAAVHVDGLAVLREGVGASVRVLRLTR